MTTSHFDRLGSSEAPDSFTGQTLTRFWGHNITLGGGDHQPFPSAGGGGEVKHTIAIQSTSQLPPVAWQAHN